MPSRIEENKYEIMDILIKINHAGDEIKEDTLKIEQIMASGVVTQEEDYAVRVCRRLIKFSNGQLASYKYCLSWCLCAEGISDEERIEAERKAYLLHQAACTCLQVTRLNQAVRDLQDSSTETPDESLIELMRQIEEMAREIVRRVAEIERELALISASRALENLRNLVREAGE
ncbi:uncharacterized protein EAE97_002272 [Botrytis byssoidea]|uniref:Uncharacterized protein n=1 Tax=Botrytis byssoidea TaxID=139641 RepID=A0A9P5M8M1_9HELO|nr:uncharacterized protein EAE97_002272 [Botrytis byssoidea]KAF7950720.1 hypothetical protein EAE97_002272 [Botrytis byssoidea]